ncbi:MAG TPA: GGDEF domain-containing protein [Candidatus Binatus sp.]|nr:GGDEF domain-containing protein [Candidatus Binatus sp.]
MEGLLSDVVSVFVANPMATLDAESAAQALNAPAHAVGEALDALARLGIAQARLAHDGTLTYQFRLADSFLDVLERLTLFYTEQLQTVAILPERALLTSGEAIAEPATIRSLRARVASLETANNLLQRKNLELSFLYNASTLLASSIEPMTLAQAVLEAVGAATNGRAKAYFVALVDQELLTFQGGENVDKLSAEAFLTRHAALIDAAIEKGSLVSMPRQGRVGRSPEAPFVVAPLSSGPGGRGHGCIAIVDIAPEGLGSDDLRILIQLAEMAGRSLDNAEIFTQSVSIGATDELTGAHNRRYLFRRLAEEITRARLSGAPLSVFIFDIDHFKEVNDRYGHAEGDRMLKEIVGAATRAVRDIDLVARFGGEEFAVILPGTEIADAVAIAERVRNAVGGLRHLTQSGVMLTTAISAGVAALRDLTQTPAQLLAAADECLLEAKRAGRNRTIAAP